VSNDYRSRNRNDSGWYYSEGKRYVPRSMMEGDRQNGRPPARRRRRPPSGGSRGGYSQYYPAPKQGGRGLNRSGRIARAVFISSLSLLLLLVIVVGGVCIYVQTNILNRITFVDDSYYAVSSSDPVEEMVIEDDSDSGQGEEMSAEESAALQAMISGGLVSEENLYREEGVTNILLLGTDNRGKSLKGSRSDTMIILSVNEKTRQIIMTSIMRDVCVSIPGRSSVNKINAAHAYGGPPLAVKTVETNFGVDIDRYICINFYAFIDIVDALGGLELTINEQERNVMNNYITEINAQLGLGADNGKLYKTGTDLLLSGKQVLGYVRNRYTGNGDFARTERQRIALNKMIEKCKSSDLSTLLKVIEAAASYMSTNYDQGELVGFASNALEYLDYEMVNARLPKDDTWRYARLNDMSIIEIDINANRKELIKIIYGK